MDGQKCLEVITSLETHHLNGLTFIVTYFDSKDLPKAHQDFTYSLLQSNMRAMYEACDWGWKPKQKIKELSARQARFLIVYEVGSRKEHVPVAFVHFRFVKDYGRKVVYCYELQLEAQVRGYGVGSWLMKILERLAAVSNFSRIVLTVLKSNLGAISFYKKMGYDLDETNPPKSEGRPYYIFSKTVPSDSETSTSTQ